MALVICLFAVRQNKPKFRICGHFLAYSCLCVKFCFNLILKMVILNITVLPRYSRFQYSWYFGGTYHLHLTHISEVSFSCVWRYFVFCFLKTFISPNLGYHTRACFNSLSSIFETPKLSLFLKPTHFSLLLSRSLFISLSHTHTYSRTHTLLTLNLSHFLSCTYTHAFSQVIFFQTIYRRFCSVGRRPPLLKLVQGF